MKKILGIILASALFLVSCGEKSLWYSDLEAAKKSAKKEGKDIYLLFSGDDWDGLSVTMKEKIVKTAEFEEYMKDKYILVNVDLSQDKFMKAQVGPEATKKEKKAAKKFAKEIEDINRLTMIYAIKQFPTASILTSGGYKLTNVHYDELLETPADYIANITNEGVQRVITERKAMIAKIDESEGAEKANAIHELVGKTNMDEIFLVRDYVEELPKIDPKNESGLVPTYKIRAAYYYSFDPTTKAEEAEKAFIDLVDDEDLNDAEKFEAYFMAAYSLASKGSENFDKILSYLDSANALENIEDYQKEMAADLIGKIKQLQLDMEKQAEEEKKAQEEAAKAASEAEAAASVNTPKDDGTVSIK